MAYQIPASPDSSEAFDSIEATPATKFSAFSSDGTRISSGSTGRGIVRPRVPPPFDLQVVTSTQQNQKTHKDSNVSGNHDPFVVGSPLTSTTTRSSTDPSKLSPSAAAFTPSSIVESPAFADQLSSPSGKQTSGKLVNRLTAPQMNISHIQTSSEVHVAHRSPSTSFAECMPDAMGAFSSENVISRYLMIYFARGTSVRVVEQRLQKERRPSLKELVCADLSSNGIVTARFSDLRDAISVVTELGSTHAQHIGILEYYARRRRDLSKELQVAHDFEGQILVIAKFGTRNTQAQHVPLKRSILEALEQYGDIFAFKTILAEPSKLILRVEFCDVVPAYTLVKENGDMSISGSTVSFEAYTPDSKALKQAPSRCNGPVIIGQETPELSQTFDRISLQDQSSSSLIKWSGYVGPPQVLSNSSYTDRKGSHGAHTPSPLLGLSHGGHGLASPYSPSWNSSFAGHGLASPLWSPFSPGAIGQERSSPTASHEGYAQQRTDLRLSNRQPTDFPNSGHNIVDMDRIRAGLDVRTTIMLRNIPNKIDQAMLKEIIDETSLGKYDFMYLRIDFANNCNVGYAFINFFDPIWIVDFVNARAGHRWNRYNSDKVAEVSYATIQGRDCLIQKFRNSSVMLEHPSFRPKLFRTGAGPLVGTEEDFPGPDNPSKMRRSVENAEHVGLFAPRAGQNFRDEQRRRRSQFDRGTRLSDVSEVYDRNDQHLFNQASMYRPIQGIPNIGSTYQGLNGSHY